MASVGRPRGFGSDPPTGSGRAWRSLQLGIAHPVVGITISGTEGAPRDGMHPRT